MGNDNKKNTVYIAANAMNIFAKFQLHPPYGFLEEDFLNICRKFSVSVAMATNQNQRFGQNSYGW